MHQFQVIKQLGSGSFGRVLKVRRRQDQGIFAMKTVKMNQLNAKQKQNALNQVRLLASIDSPNVIKYKGAFFQQCGDTLSIVMQFADGGDLAGLIQKKKQRKEIIQQSFIWKVAFDLLKGLNFLHKSHIIHRDIKSANVFFAGGVAKIGDLNVSKIMQGNFATTQTGTPYYTSPQIWLGRKYTTSCDIWSLGCLLYQLCCLRPPFMAKDIDGLSKKVTSGYYDPIPSRYTKKLSNLIRKCLTVDNVKRSSASELLNTDVFLSMDSPQQGQFQLLDTIRCPRVLKHLNKQLPENQYQQKKPKTLKTIEDNSYRGSQNSSKHIPRSMKRIDSQRDIRIASIEKSKLMAGYVGNNNQMLVPRPIYGIPPMSPVINNPSNKVIPALNAVVNSPNGYVKLPRIESYKRLQ